MPDSKDLLEPVKERFFHPIVGPFIWTFLAVNYELVIAFLGAVANPSFSYALVKAWAPALSISALVTYVFVPLFWIFGAPRLQRFWLWYAYKDAHARFQDRLDVDGIAHIPPKLLDDALEFAEEQKGAHRVVSEKLGVRGLDSSVVARGWYISANLSAIGDGRIQEFGGQLRQMVLELEEIGLRSKQHAEASTDYLKKRRTIEAFIPGKTQ